MKLKKHDIADIIDDSAMFLESYIAQLALIPGEVKADYVANILERLHSDLEQTADKIRDM